MKLTWRTFKWLVIIGSLPPIYYQIKGIFDEDYGKIFSWGNFALWFAISVGTTILLSVVVFREISWLQKILPWKKSVAKRITVEFVITLSTVLLGMFLLSLYTYPMHCRVTGIHISHKAHLFEEFTTGVILWAILISVTEGVFFFNEWKTGLVLSEKLQKEKVESQMEALRNQANPHFLFNSLNVLSSLVHSDPDKAEEFIGKFASVYRYVLNFQDKNLVTLKEELDFLNSYLFLQKIRFTNGLDIILNIDKEHEKYFVLPFSLQFMVENAIKHNIVSKESPLKIEVYIENSKLCVVNNIQLRDNQDETTGMGLKNLRQRYFLLANVMPENTEKDGEFIVCIPLIKPEKDKKTENKNECCPHKRHYIRHKKAVKEYCKSNINKVRDKKKTRKTE